MSKKKLDDEAMYKRVRLVLDVLRNHDDWVSTAQLCEETSMSISQVKGAVKFERRYFLKCPEKCENYYILSGVRGYKITKTDEDYLAMYESLYSWAISVLITISPVNKYLLGKGYDMAEVRRKAKEAAGDPSLVGGKDAWHE